MIKFFFYLLLFFNFSNLYSVEPKLEIVYDMLDKPWSLSFIDRNNVIITEKSGNFKKLNLTNKQISDIKHNLKILEDGQGGLLDVLVHEEYIYASYSENRGQGRSSTSVARAKFNTYNLDFKKLFQAEPPIDSGFHFGSRLVIKENKLYISVGERGEGMIAQDPTKHPGSIVRINLDGSIPKDNPKFRGKRKWLPEIYQIGVRNPQGMALSPFDGNIYMTNHGARGGDWFGLVKKGENYGWKILGWGGINYSGTKIGPKWRPGYTKAIRYWVPSIAVSALTIYNGEEFKEWKGQAIIASLKGALLKIKFLKNKFLFEEMIFKGNIGRIRDIKIQEETGQIFMLSDSGKLWKLRK